MQKPNSQKAHAIRIAQFGDPTVLQYQEISLNSPQANEVLVATKAIGVNFIDIYMREGSYPRPLPAGLGLEGAGVVQAVGAAVKTMKCGDRVAWAGIPNSYATHILAPADKLVLLPDEITFEQGAASMLQGMTTHYLTHGAYWLQEGDTCLVHAAAGGVGLLLCQVAKMLGAAQVIGTVSTEEKAKLARAAGADNIIFYTRQNVIEEVKKLTAKQGVNVVYDSVGKDTFEASLASLSARGFLVSYGQSSGDPAPFDLAALRPKSLSIVRPSLPDYIASREELLIRANTVFQWLLSGKLHLRIDSTYPLTQASIAHEALAGRKTSGKLLLIPE